MILFRRYFKNKIMELSFWPMWGGNLQSDLCVLQEGPPLFPQAAELFLPPSIESTRTDAQNSPHLCFLEEEMAFPGEDGVWVARIYPLC